MGIRREKTTEDKHIARKIFTIIVSVIKINMNLSSLDIELCILLLHMCHSLLFVAFEGCFVVRSYE